jgi:integration host factor subunit beta
MKNYIKKDIIELVMDRTGQKQQDCAQSVDAIFAVLREMMAGAIPGCRIEVRDFGIFEVKQTKPKPTARNPRTGELVYVPSRRKTHFRPGRLLKDALRQPLDEQGRLVEPKEEQET